MPVEQKPSVCAAATVAAKSSNVLLVLLLLIIILFLSNWLAFLDVILVRPKA